MIYTVYVAGTPRPQPRARHVRTSRLKTHVISTADDGTKLYIEKVRQACRRAIIDADVKPKIEAAHVKLDFWFATWKAKRHGLPHTNVPDCDNLAKLWMDAAQHKSVKLLPDGDQRVASLTVVKRWALSGGALMTIEPCDHGGAADEDEDDLGAGELEA